MEQLLVEKYKPKTLLDIIGHDKTLFALKGFAESWRIRRPAYKSAYLYGPPGTGKTTAVQTLAHDFGWEIVEVNASERPKYDELVQEITVATQFSNVNGLNLVVIEEIDGLATGRPLKRTLQALEKIIERTHNPVIITCNNEYGVKRLTEYYRKNSLMLRFTPLKEYRIKAFLLNVMRQEGIEQPQLDKLIRISNRDIRYCLNNLETKEVVPRLVEHQLFDIVHSIFRGEWNGDSAGLEMSFVWYAVESNIDNFYDDIYGMPVADFKMLVDRLITLQKRIGRRQGVALSFIMERWIRNLLRTLPMHQKSEKIVVEKSQFKKSIVSDVASYATDTHQSYKKARSQLGSYPELLAIYRRGRETIKEDESENKTDSVLVSTEPVSVDEQAKAVAKQQSLF